MRPPLLGECALDGEEAPHYGASVVLDYGAFPAFMRGEQLTLTEQLDGLHEGLSALGSASSL